VTGDTRGFGFQVERAGNRQRTAHRRETYLGCAPGQRTWRVEGGSFSSIRLMGNDGSDYSPKSTSAKRAPCKKEHAHCKGQTFLRRPFQAHPHSPIRSSGTWAAFLRYSLISAGGYRYVWGEIDSRQNTCAGHSSFRRRALTLTIRQSIPLRALRIRSRSPKHAYQHNVGSTITIKAAHYSPGTEAI